MKVVTCLLLCVVVACSRGGQASTAPSPTLAPEPAPAAAEPEVATTPPLDAECPLLAFEEVARPVHVSEHCVDPTCADVERMLAEAEVARPDALAADVDWETESRWLAQTFRPWTNRQLERLQAINREVNRLSLRADLRASIDARIALLLDQVAQSILRIPLPEASRGDAQWRCVFNGEFNHQATAFLQKAIEFYASCERSAATASPPQPAVSSFCRARATYNRQLVEHGIEHDI